MASAIFQTGRTLPSSIPRCALVLPLWRPGEGRIPASAPLTALALWSGTLALSHEDLLQTPTSTGTQGARFLQPL